MSSTATAVVNFIVPAVRLPLCRFPPDPIRRICSTRASLHVAQTDVPRSAPDLARVQDILAQVCARARVSPSSQSTIVELCTELIEYGKHTNLTGVKTLSGAILLHGVDSLSLLPTLDKLAENSTNSAGLSIVDIGSGAGFPGFPIAIARPDNARVSLVESTRKKVDFQKHVIAKLGISNVTPVWGRVEEIERKASFDVATARAVAKLHILAEYALPLVKKGGLFMAQKSFSHAELKEAEKAIRVLGGEIADVKPAWTEQVIREFSPSAHEEREEDKEREKCLVLIEKIKDTPPSYPRSHSAIKRNPL